MRSIKVIVHIFSFRVTLREKSNKKHLTPFIRCSNIIKNQMASLETVDVEIKTERALTERPEAEKGQNADC